MAYEVYIGKNFDYPHERRALSQFLTDLHECFAESDRLFCVVVEPQVNDAEIDLLLISHTAIIVAELKELGQAEHADRRQIHLLGTENGWRYRLPDGREITHGSHSPYRQVRRMRKALSKWLAAHSAALPGGPWDETTAERSIAGRVVISPGFNGDTTDLELPAASRAWFNFIALDDLVAEIDQAQAPARGPRLTAAQMRALIQQLGVRPCTNLRELMPNYTPPAPLFAAHPPGLDALADRAEPAAALMGLLDDPAASTLVLQGPMGIGRTALAAWLASQARQRDYRVRWLDCEANAGATLDSLLTAVSAEIPDLRRAGIRDAGRPLDDRLDAALDFLDQRPTLLVFDDYHALTHRQEINAFIARAARFRKHLRLLLTSRQRLLDPHWPPGAVRETEVTGGLPYDDFVTFAGGVLRSAHLSPADMKTIWQRLSGNPQALMRSQSLIRQYALMGRLGDLPLPESDAWFNSLAGSLSPEASALANRLALVRLRLTFHLIVELSGLAPEAASALTLELIDRYLLERAPDANTFSINTLARGLFEQRLPDKGRRTLHQQAGECFARLADAAPDELLRAEYLLEALHHFERGGPRKQWLRRAAEAFDLLVRLGDRNRAAQVAQAAIDQARAEDDASRLMGWLLKAAELELDNDRRHKAVDWLHQAQACLPTAGQKLTPVQRAAWRRHEFQLRTARGRAHYRVPDYDAAAEDIEQAHQLAEQMGDTALLAETLPWLGRLEWRRKGYAAASAYLQRAVNLAKEMSDHSLLCEALSLLGLVERSQGRLEAARQYFEQALQVAHDTDQPTVAAITLGHLGRMALKRGDFASARSKFQICLDYERRMGLPIGVRIQLVNLTEVLLGLGQLREAEAALQEAEALNSAAGDGIGIAWSLKQRGQLLRARGKNAAGIALIRQGLNKLHEIGSREYVADFEAALNQATQMPLGLEAKTRQ